MRILAIAAFSLFLGTYSFGAGEVQFIETDHDFEIIKEDGGKVTYIFGFKNIFHKILYGRINFINTMFYIGFLPIIE